MTEAVGMMQEMSRSAVEALGEMAQAIKNPSHRNSSSNSSNRCSKGMEGLYRMQGVWPLGVWAAR